MSIFGKIGKSVGLGPLGGSGGNSGFRDMARNPQAMAAMQAAKSQFRGQGPVRGMAGVLKAGRAAMNQPQPAPQPAGIGQAPPPQMAGAGMAPPPQMAQMGMEQYGGLGPSGPPQPAPGPSALQAGIQQAIGGNPQETDPYEAWKAGGRQGNRPAGY